MKSTCAFLFAILACSCCWAQDDYQAAGPESRAYHQYRHYSTTPPYGLEKVRQLIKARTVRREDQDEDAGTDSLPEKLYRSLSLQEKFTYNMIYGEYYSQNCDIDEATKDEEKKIFGNLPRLFSEKAWSDRQDAFFKDNKDSVISLMTGSIIRVKRVGLCNAGLY